MKRHHLDAVSLSAGLAFIGFSALVLAGRMASVGHHLKWGAAILLIAVGTTLVLTSLTRDPSTDDDGSGDALAVPDPPTTGPLAPYPPTDPLTADPPAGQGPQGSPAPDPLR
ncbi:MAG TPA: hypothetical protein VNE62_09310 [Actinomycetota bacterium]|nr:hypothetical protein [Actinomycetota bacterium]